MVPEPIDFIPNFTSSYLTRPTSKMGFIETCALLRSSSLSWYQTFGVLLKSTTPVPLTQLSGEPPTNSYEPPKVILTP
ncbi:unnamed protein product [Linum trigynum]|uniref:Uncharacterized protein n=1 Tax=Linum trigynum TaxID=586398 RepID=A0AAV2DAG2_9ROSI